MKLHFGSVTDVRGFQAFEVQASFDAGRDVFAVNGLRKGMPAVELAKGDSRTEAHILRDLLAVANARYR